MNQTESVLVGFFKCCYIVKTVAVFHLVYEEKNVKPQTSL